MNNQKVIEALLNQDLAEAQINLEIVIETGDSLQLEELSDTLLRLWFIR